jgi:hypothetical protein
MTSYKYAKIIINDNIIVPLWILDDVGYFYPDVYNHIIKEHDDYVIFNITFKDEFIQLRKQIYWLCQWHPTLFNVPMIEASIYNINNMNNVIEEHLTHHFVRFCNASPKDICKPIFKKGDDVLSVFKSSPRTNYMFDLPDHHIILRPIVKIDHEVRCFWHNFKLRAVSGPGYYIDNDNQNNIKTLINDFFKNYKDEIVYHSATFDIGIEDDKAFIIEINSFGIDMLAGSGHFKWHEDFMILYNAKEPLYRFKGEFDW